MYIAPDYKIEALESADVITLSMGAAFKQEEEIMENGEKKVTTVIDVSYLL